MEVRYKPTPRTKFMFITSLLAVAPCATSDETPPWGKNGPPCGPDRQLQLQQQQGGPSIISVEEKK